MNAEEKRKYRQSLRDQGLVCREVWIHPSRNNDLKQLRRKLRKPKKGAN